MTIFNLHTRKYLAVGKEYDELRFLRYGSSYTHCCRAFTFASARLSCIQSIGQTGFENSEATSDF